ncbi:hypothetical protein [Streptomyces rubiginosohelvolus]|uniref:hypothetical protein n=1 Tax=Streptomyces rubiginosohelvolus TaxID=67362 RepID=UPI0035DDC7E7
MTTIPALIAATTTLAAGYLLGRLRPWLRLGDWAVDQIRFAGPWATGSRARQLCVLLAHAVTEPRTTWRIIRTRPDKEGRA